MPASPFTTDAELEASHAARDRARRKALWCIAGGLALLCGLFLWRAILDEAPPGNSDLRVAYSRPPEQRNAYALLAKLAATLPPTNDEGPSKERHLSLNQGGKVAWDREAVTSMLDRYPPTLADSVRAALAAPETESPEIKSYDDTLPEIGGFRNLARVLTQQARIAWQDGDHATASERNLMALKLGDLISRSRGPIITVLTGTAIKLMALEEIQRHSDTDSITSEALRGYLSEIGRHEIRPSDYHAAYKLEHVAFINTVRSFKSPNRGSPVPSGKFSWPSAAIIPGLWQPNRTIRWHAECVREAIHAPPQTPASGTSGITRKRNEYFDDVDWPRRAQNITGRILLAIVVPTFEKLNTTCHRARANLRLTEVYVALRLYHHEHEGALPSALDELVPRYLPAVPLDPFDSKPLRYSCELSSIWSIDHENLQITDADGDLPKGAPAYRLRFARSPKRLSAFAEYEALQNGDAKFPANGPRSGSAASDVTTSE